MENEKNYTVIVDETCEKHGGHNFSYQYDNENFERIESVCEGCQSGASEHVPSAQLQAKRAVREPQERAFRPTR